MYWLFHLEYTKQVDQQHCVYRPQTCCKSSRVAGPVTSNRKENHDVQLEIVNWYKLLCFFPNCRLILWLHVFSGTSHLMVSFPTVSIRLSLSKHKQRLKENMFHLCFLPSDGSGGWNPRGCYVRNSTDNETICGCNHLTSFAILLVRRWSSF